MKRKFEFVMGLFASIEVIYKMIKCPSCEESILWFEVSGLVFTVFWAAIAIILFYGVYKENWTEKERNNILELNQYPQRLSI